MRCACVVDWGVHSTMPHTQYIACVLLRSFHEWRMCIYKSKLLVFNHYGYSFILNKHGFISCQFFSTFMVVQLWPVFSTHPHPHTHKHTDYHPNGLRWAVKPVNKITEHKTVRTVTFAMRARDLYHLWLLVILRYYYYYYCYRCQSFLYGVIHTRLVSWFSYSMVSHHSCVSERERGIRSHISCCCVILINVQVEGKFLERREWCWKLEMMVTCLEPILQIFH